MIVLGHLHRYKYARKIILHIYTYAIKIISSSSLDKKIHGDSPDSFFNTAKSRFTITMFNCHCRTRAVSTGINTVYIQRPKKRRKS